MPEVEDYSFLILPVPVETSVPEVMKYAYDEKNRLDEENVVTGMTDFDYRYDADGNITECILTYRMLNDEGPMLSNDYIRYYDIKY